jgi:hypothetical protein
MLSRLYTLVLVVLVAWSSCTVFELIGVSVCALVSMCALLLSDRGRACLPIALLSVAMLFALLLLAGTDCREAARRTQCTYQLRQIALALLNYEQVYKSFPPAYITDKNGKPMHSWRVLILPYMECESLYKQYDLNEPWDGPNNKKLLAARPRMLACPSDGQAYAQDATCTSYVAVVGSNAFWPGEMPRRFDDADFNGRSSNTIMLVEVADAGIHWTEPKDLDADAFQAAGHSPSQVTVSSKHMRSNGFFYCDTLSIVNVALADGSVRAISSGNLTPDKLNTLLAIGGCTDNDIVSTDREEELQINWPHCIALAVWLISVSLLLYQAVRSRRAAPPRPEESAA